jgi:hypothetical protein
MIQIVLKYINDRIFFNTFGYSIGTDLFLITPRDIFWAQFVFAGVCEPDF